MKQTGEDDIQIMETELMENDSLLTSQQQQTDPDAGLDVVETPSSLGSPRKTKASRANLNLNIKAATHLQQRSYNTMLSPNTPHSCAGTPKPITVAVFLKDGDHRLLLLDRGKLTSAGEIRHQMMQVLSLPDTAEHVFALWFLSPHLELQLKDHHVPFLLRKQWLHLLTSFSDCQDQEEAMLDEPVLVFQRNSFLSVADEEKITDELITQRLFKEARYNIVNSRYPIPVPEAEMLAGMLMQVDNGHFDPNTHKNGYFRKSLSKYLPYYAIGQNRLLQYFKSSTLECRLTERYKHTSQTCRDTLDCQRKFLNYVRSLPYYGSAFFRGILNFDSKHRWSSSEKSITIGLNRNGISLFKEHKNEALIHLPYDDFSWAYIKSTDGVDGLCVEYDCEDNSEQIPIESRQACMMDAMIESCVNYMNRLKIPKTPSNMNHSRLSEMAFPSSFYAKKANFSLSRTFSVR